METLVWLVLLFAVPITLAYRRIDLRTSTAALGVFLIVYTFFGAGGFLWTLFLWVLFAGLAFLNVENLRRDLLTRRVIGVYRRMLPRMSKTEQDALEAGNVWWDGELFSGMPDWRKLLRLPPPQLTAEEQAFLDGPCEELCRMLDDWEITHELLDMPPNVWRYLKEQKFFAMIIPKEYGGLGFSPLASSMILTKVSSRNATASSTIGVPNSLGPAELLLHYGTDEQKQRWLPGLASGEEVPCFALTSPRVGSDATALIDSGVVTKGMWEGHEIIGIRLNWEKRYITLAPVATVLGLAFKLYDPDHLIGDVDEYGITSALIPTNLPGIEIGRRHFPINIPFQNGPTRGKDVFVPLDAIIGGPKMAGQGWRMLVQLLAVGRSIVLPSNALGAAMAAVYASGAYARLRRQFGLPIGKFHGVGEALARMAGNLYTMTAASRVTCTALANGEKPAVPSAILKYHNTELGRQIANDGMDVHGGKAIMLGPKNYMARGYESVPIAITVEGANILTRNLIIFGQGAIRCHPFVRAEMDAAKDEDRERGLVAFDRLLFKHLGYTLSNAARSWVQALTLARFTDVPSNGPTRRYYQHINRYSASFALITDAAMLTLGGELKRRELLSARLGDVSELPVSRVDGAEALPGPRRAARGSAARRMGLPHSALQDPGAAARADAQLPEPLDGAAAAPRDLPARPDVFGAIRRARPGNRGAADQPDRHPRASDRGRVQDARARQSARLAAGGTRARGAGQTVRAPRVRRTPRGRDQSRRHPRADRRSRGERHHHGGRSREHPGVRPQGARAHGRRRLRSARPCTPTRCALARFRWKGRVLE